MNSISAFSRRKPLIEPLEQRIAPALLVNGANLLGGIGNPKTGETSISGNSVTLVKVLSGEAIVWFDHGSIDAISVGPNTALDITGDVGTILGNLTASGQLSDSDNNPSNGLDGGVLLPNNILGITTHPLSNELGSIGNIITGGSISNLNISGNLMGAYAGTGVFRPDSTLSGGHSVTVGIGVDINPILAGLQTSFIFPSSDAKTVASGASIANVKVGAAEELQLFAGNGFAGLPASPGHPAQAGKPGGSISNITIENAFIDTGLNAATPSYYMQAGDGGAGTSGGAGGGIRNINEISSSGVVDIIGGQGGDGTGGAGGAGGSINGLNMESVSSSYTIHGGKGGTGAPGGAGGSVKGTNFGGDSLSNGIIVTGLFTGRKADDILLVNSLTGTMVIEQNDGDGSGFTPVIQDPFTQLATIAPIGSKPVGAVAVDVNGDGLIDIVVAYGGTHNIGVFINQGKGVFYQENFTGGNYTGDTLEATSTALPYAPTQIAAGNFTGDASTDLALLLNNAGQTELITLAGDGKGGFSVPNVMVPLSANPVSLVAANFPGDSFIDLVVGFKTGLIEPLLANGASTGVPFTAANVGVTMAGGIANLDYDTQDGLLLALNGAGNLLSIYTAGSGGVLTSTSSIDLTQQAGTALVAHFVPQQQTGESIEVLSSVSGGSRLDVYSAEGAAYVLAASTQSTEALRNFVPVIEGATTGVAAVGGTLGHFAFSQNEGAFYDVGLPFSGKKVSLEGGDGGAGINAATGIARGGAGGEVYGMSILAGDITLEGGNGGASENAPAGAGGLVGDSPVLVTSTGQSVPTLIEADFVLTVAAGSGGSASGTAHTASGGAGGSVEGLDLSLMAGDMLISSGNGGTGGGAAGGAGGLVAAVKAVNHGGDLDVAAGSGGAAAGAVGNGGAGGSIFNLTYSLSLTTQTVESPYNVALVAGAGGASNAAIGGTGGSVGQVSLTLQPSNESVTDGNASPATEHVNTDSTLRVTMTAGNGGGGATGGAGGSLKTITSTSVFQQIVVLVGASASDTVTFAEVNPVTAILTAGNGGNGSKAAGGAGGTISGFTLVGISHYDPDAADPQAGQSPLVITSGNGGNGATVGGAGGAIAGVSSLNAQFTGSTTGNLNLTATELGGATIVSGQGGNGGTGNGGAGGAIGKLSIGVSGFVQAGVITNSGSDFFSGGEMTIQSGAGGSGGAAGKGGAGGGIGNSLIGCADAYQDYGLLLEGGAGGRGGLGGGAGGGVTGIQLNAPQNPNGNPVTVSPYDTLATLILAGNGGAATGASAVGGAGGGIGQITESKDVGSSINLLQAGNGGAALGTGGLGGSVTGVRTVGLIGQASDDSGNTFGAFQTDVNPAIFGTLFPAGVPEGVFAGRGGTGATSGAPGSVTAINAAQIAAIGAAVNSSGLFAAASKVSDITAEVIGYDVNGNGVYNNATGKNRSSPAVAAPIDGFIFSETVPTGVITSNNTLLEGFTFVG